MSLIAFKCVVELGICEVNAPGVRLANKEDLYLNVCMLGQQRRTRLAPPLFPLRFSDNLIFEKTFKFCRDVCDVVYFLNDLNIIIELVQLGNCGGSDEILAWHQSNAKQFLYPTPDCRVCYHSMKRDLFLNRHARFPGAIDPILMLCSSVRIYETMTPAMDMLKENENKIIYDPLIDMKRKGMIGGSKQPQREKQQQQQQSAAGGLRRRKSNKPINRLVRNDDIDPFNIAPLNESFASHTISSAIKADYGQRQVQQKLEELNNSVKRTRSIKFKPEHNCIKQYSKSKPFVVRHANEDLILRKPKGHDVLNDGLVLTKKNCYRNMHYGDGSGSSRSRSRSRSARSRSSSSQQRSRSVEPFIYYPPPPPPPPPPQQQYYPNSTNSSSVYETVRFVRPPSASSSGRRRRCPRLSRSLSPKLAAANNSMSLDEDLLIENERRRRLSRSRSRSTSPRVRFSSSVERDSSSRHSSAASSVSNCDVCSDHGMRGENLRKMGSANVNSVFHNVGSKNPNNRMNNNNNNNNQAFKNAKIYQEMLKRNTNLVRRGRKLPADKCSSEYAEYYPWLHDYNQYLRCLEDQLHWLKVRNSQLNNL